MPKLVLADDSTTIQKVVELSFASEEVEVQCFSDGATALEYLRTHPADIVLADTSLPSVDGYSLCEQLKSDWRTRDIPVVLLAATFEPFDGPRAQQAGYAASLTKPFDTGELVDLVRRLLRSPLPDKGTGLAEPEPVPALPESQGGLFRVPVERGNGEVVFSLEPGLCKASFSPLLREVQEAGPAVESLPQAAAEAGLEEERLEALVQEVLARLSKEVRAAVLEVTREFSQKR